MGIKRRNCVGRERSYSLGHAGAQKRLSEGEKQVQNQTENGTLGNQTGCMAMQVGSTLESLCWHGEAFTLTSIE